MAETVAEQLLYGDHCRHGTNIGTPGGADLMCQPCEMGLFRWVNDPLYTLTLDGISFLGWNFRVSEMGKADRAKAKVRRWLRMHSHHWDGVWEMRQLDAGYWTE